MHVHVHGCVCVWKVSGTVGCQGQNMSSWGRVRHSSEQSRWELMMEVGEGEQTGEGTGEEKKEKEDPSDVRGISCSHCPLSHSTGKSMGVPALRKASWTIPAVGGSKLAKISSPGSLACGFSG